MLRPRRGRKQPGQFSKIAVLKYRAGFYKSEVRMLVVSITANDMF